MSDIDDAVACAISNLEIELETGVEFGPVNTVTVKLIYQGDVISTSTVDLPNESDQ